MTSPDGGARKWDLFAIGGGSAGVRVARTAAGLGARAAVAEVLHLGGTCVNVGCIPKKLLSYAAEYGEALREARAYGWSAAGELDWSALIAAKNAEIERLHGVYGRMLDKSGAVTLTGRARVVGPHEVEVDGVRHEAEHIVICTGGRPSVPAIPGRELGCTSNEAFFLSRRPDRVLIVGGGFIGVEFAAIFAGCGAEVTLLDRNERLLHHMDADIGRHLGKEYERKGIGLALGRTVVALGRRDGGVRAHLDDGSTHDVDLVLFATGRRPNTQGLGLEDVGVALADDGAVIVDEGWRSSVPSILALGDAKKGPQLTPWAIAEATALARRLFGGGAPGPDDLVPTAVFGHPPVGTVGLSEEAARARGEVDVYRSTFVPLRHRIGERREAMVKLVVDRPTQRVLGVHVVGEDAPEIVQGFAVALRCGATKAQFDATLAIHPTLAEELVLLR